MRVSHALTTPHPTHAPTIVPFLVSKLQETSVNDAQTIEYLRKPILRRPRGHRLPTQSTYTTPPPAATPPHVLFYVTYSPETALHKQYPHAKERARTHVS